MHFEGRIMKNITGVVGKVVRAPKGCSGTLYDGKGEAQFYSDIQFHQGACINAEGETAAGTNGRFVIHKATILDGDDARKIYRDAADHIKSIAASSITEEPALLQDKFMLGFWPQVHEVALELLASSKLARPAIIRFHGDADGVCGALAISSLLVSAKTFQQNSAAYSVRGANRDIDMLSHEPNALVVLIDFGSSVASVEGLRTLKSSGIETILIDHHPGDRNIADQARVLNTQLVSGGGTKYTAGYLCCEIMATLGSEIGKSRAITLARTACAGDKSTIFDVDDSDTKRAMVIDFLASHKRFGNKLEFYRDVLSNDELFHSIAGQAEEEIDVAAEKAMRGMRRIEGKYGLTTVLIPLEKVVTKGEWPPSSKITTRVYDVLNSEKPGRGLVCLGYTDRSVIMRLNDAALERGLSATSLAEKLKTSMPDFIEGGGGHPKAGAIRAKPGFVKEVIGELVREIETGAASSG